MSRRPEPLAPYGLSPLRRVLDKVRWPLIQAADPLVGSDGQSVPADIVCEPYEGEDDLQATGVDVLESAADDVQGSKDRFMLYANTGRPMRVKGYVDPVIIDIAGARYASKRTPVIMDHDTRQRVGHATEQAIVAAGQRGVIGGREVSGPMIAATGVRSSSSKAAKEFVSDAKDGFPFQVSVGARVLSGHFVPEGKTADVNGRTWSGPLVVARRTLIRELTTTVLGADGNTSAQIAARDASNGDLDMDFEAYVKSLGLEMGDLTAEAKTALKAQWEATQRTPPANPATPPVNADDNGVPVDVISDDDRLAARRRLDADEDQRQADIRAIASRYESGISGDLTINGQEMPLLQARALAIREGLDSRDFELACLRASRSQPSGPAIHSVDNGSWDNQAVACSILRAQGTVPESGENSHSGRRFGLDQMFTEQQLQLADDPRYRGITHISQLFDLQIRAAGRHWTGLNRSGSDFQAMAVQAWQDVRASGFSTLNITNILENTMHKAALASFGAAEGVWRMVCGRRNVSDFRPHNLYRLTTDGNYTKVSVTGELKHVSMVDTKYSLQAETYGAMITIDRKTRKNDDLGLVVDKARSLGTLGAQRIEESVFVLLLSNPGSFFAVGNNNLLSGATSTLGDLDQGEGLDAARLLFRNQVSNGKPTSVSPRILLTGTTLETTANRLWNQERVELAADSSGGQVFVNNPHKGLYRPVISPYLNNTDITDQDGAALSGQSDTQWYLLADPTSPLGSVLVIGFMDGRETPWFDESETQFNVPDGIQMRSYLDWAVAMHVTELGVKSAGA